MEDLVPQMFSFLCIGFFAIIFLGLGIMIVIMNRKSQKKADASHSWAASTGMLISAEVKESESVPDEFHQSKPIFYPEVIYEYSVGGQKYSGRRLSFGGSETFATWQAASDRISTFTRGLAVTVYYDPSNPGNSVLSRVAKKSSLGLILGGIFILLGSCALFSILIMIITRVLPSL